MRNKFKKPNVFTVVCSALFSFFFCMSFVLGIQLKNSHMTWFGVKGKLAIIAISLLISLFITPIIYLLINKVGESWKKDAKSTISVKDEKLVFFISFLGIFLLWFPTFLAFYPAIMSYDFNVQYISARSGQYTTHHPLIHTFLIRLFLLLGDFWGSVEIGMAIFSLIQMLILTSVLAASCKRIAILSSSKTFGFVAAAFFSLFPVHSILSICIKKDVLF